MGSAEAATGNASVIVELGAVVIDCRDAAPMAAFYQAACGGEIVHRDDDSAWLRVGGTTVVFREVDGYQAPTWPSSNVPMQAHLDFVVDDPDQAETLLHRHGTTTPEHQPRRGSGLVMLDPAGHPFCLGARV